MGAQHGAVRDGGDGAGGRGGPTGLHQGAGVRQQLPGSGVRGFGPGGGGEKGGPCLSRCPLGRAQNVKQLYALVCETQRYSAVLDAVIAGAGLLRAEKKLRPHLAKVAGPGGGGGAGPGVRAGPCPARLQEAPLSDARERL